jgi:nucleotide-binding universal stress UspA family protein
MNDILSIRHILVPIDFSDTSMNALDTAIALAKRHNARITLVHVIDNTSFVVGEGGKILPVREIEELRESGCQAMKRLIQNQVSDAGIQCIRRSEVGNVASTVITIAKEESADVIVMGKHGASGILKFFVGSNTYRIIKNSPIPVLVVPLGRRWEYFRKILFPLRPAVGCLDKYDFVRKIIWRNNAEIHIHGVAETKAGDIVNIIAAVDYLKSQLDEDSIQNTISFFFGSSFDTKILETAKEMNTDLIVLTASLDEASQFFAGPVTQKILYSAQFPILAIKPDMGEEHLKILKWLREEVNTTFMEAKAKQYVSI